MRRQEKEPRLDKAISSVFTGVGFLLVALSVMLFAPGGRIWWFWMLIPSFTLLGGGVAEYVRYQQSRGQEIKLPGIQTTQALPPQPARVSAVPTRNTSELLQPPSVTEGTTRHLDLRAEAPASRGKASAGESAKDA